MKTLGVDNAITVRIAGGPRPSKQPKQRDDRIRPLYDLQSKQGGIQHWAKLEAAKTFTQLEEGGIEHYADLESRLVAVMEKRDGPYLHQRDRDKNRGVFLCDEARRHLSPVKAGL